MNQNLKKQIAVLSGMVLALTALLIPAGRTDAAKVQKSSAESTVSDAYTQENLLFDSSRVHIINLDVSQTDWNTMIAHATQEQYISCNVTIDGEIIQNCAIRPKGNSSLSSISQQGGDHFSFKIEFDHNDPSVTYYGLDKLCLNNLGQDPSCMKDFMAYHLMNDMGVAAPLSSYALLRLNGEDFGLYLAVEAVEDSFCLRNYGEEYGKLYKPDSFSMDTLDTSAMLDYSEGSSLWVNEKIMDGSYYADAQPGDRADILGTMLSSVFTPEQTAPAALQYIGDDPEAYADIWNSAVFKTKEEDQQRLIQSVKTLNSSENPQSVLDTESLLRYFAVHSFVNNYDSYSSLFVHNFYLHEQDGILSLVPWDYNLAFGSFNYECAVSSVLNGSGFDAVPDTGGAMDINASMINYPIDTPVYSVAMQDRPLINALLSEPETLEQYHEIYDTLLTSCFENGRYEALYAQTLENIRPYAEQGLTFYTPEQFAQGTAAMEYYLAYRAQSVRGQLDGSIPSTLEGQQQQYENLISPEGLNLTALADFASLMPGLNQDIIMQVLHIFLKEDYAYTAEGAVRAIHAYAEHPAALVKCIPPLMGIPLIRGMVLKKLTPVFAVLSLVLLSRILLGCRRKKSRNSE